MVAVASCLAALQSGYPLGSMIAVGCLPEALVVLEAGCHSGYASGASNMFLPFNLS